MTIAVVGMIQITVSQLSGTYFNTDIVRSGKNWFDAYSDPASSSANGSKTSFFNVVVRPSEMTEPPPFVKSKPAPAGYKNMQGETGIVRQFPDGTSLVIADEYGEKEADILAKFFWKTRWQRRLSVLESHVSTALIIGIFMPAVLAGTWLALSWIIAGFKAEKPNGNLRDDG